MNDYRMRADAAGYVSHRLGRRVTPAALARMASDGEGPRYVMLLGRASYREEWLDEWIAGLVQTPRKRPRKLETLTSGSRLTGGAKQDADSAAGVAA